MENGQTMENGQKTIKSLFAARRIFNIPKYQRAYAWGKKHLEEFVADLQNQPIDKDYFFGSILFQDQGVSAGFDHIDIVDGQQRITTLVIFMKLLIDRFKADKDDTTNVKMLKDTYIKQYGEYKLRVLQDDNEFFKAYILKNNLISNGEVRTPSQRRLSEAKEFLRDWIEAYPIETLRQFKDKIERMRVLTYSVKDNAEATQIFETTNDRGKSLTNLEKTKSFLMYNTYLASDSPDSLLDSLQNRFGEIYRDYERISNPVDIDTRLDEDLILQYHCIAFEAWASATDEYRQPVQMIKDKVNVLVKADERLAATNFIERCSLELKESFTVVRELLYKRIPYVLDIFALNRAAVSYALLMKAYKFDRSEDKRNFQQIARLMEIICFRLGIGGYRVDRGRKRLYELARNFKEGEFNELIIDLKGFAADFCSDKDFLQRLKSTSFHKDANRNDQLYLFWKYENYLRKEQPISSEMSYEEFTDKDPRTKFSIEHIVPQNPADSKVLADESKENLSLTMPREFEENYLHSIGNLTIDPLSANISKSNQPFEYKNQNYFRKAPLKTQNELSEFLNEKTEQWDEVSVCERAKKILGFAKDHWNPENV